MECVLDRDRGWHLCLWYMLISATLSTPLLLHSGTEMMKLVWETSLLPTSCSPRSASHLSAKVWLPLGFL